MILVDDRCGENTEAGLDLEGEVRSRTSLGLALGWLAWCVCMRYCFPSPKYP